MYLPAAVAPADGNMTSHIQVAEAAETIVALIISEIHS
jgi:hypothetical protein